MGSANRPSIGESPGSGKSSRTVSSESFWSTLSNESSGPATPASTISSFSHPDTGDTSSRSLDSTEAKEYSFWQRDESPCRGKGRSAASLAILRPRPIDRNTARKIQAPWSRFVREPYSDGHNIIVKLLRLADADASPNSEAIGSSISFSLNPTQLEVSFDKKTVRYGEYIQPDKHSIFQSISISSGSRHHIKYAGSSTAEVKPTPRGEVGEWKTSENKTEIIFRLRERLKMAELESCTLGCQLLAIRGETLLFLRNLKRISISISTEEDWVVSENTFVKETDFNGRVTILEWSQEEKVKREYHVTRQLIERGSSHSEVVIAFPLYPEPAPKKLPFQDAFAWLRIESSKLKFIVHADFDSQEGSITSSERNQGLLERVAEVFVEAAHTLHRDPGLWRHWPCYLPTKKDLKDPASFWKPLFGYIQNKLYAGAPLRLVRSDVLYHPWRGECLSLVDVRTTLKGWVYEEGKESGKVEKGVLLAGGKHFRLLNPDYSKAATTALKDYGLEESGNADFVSLISSNIATLVYMLSPSGSGNKSRYKSLTKTLEAIFNNKTEPEYGTVRLPPCGTLEHLSILFPRGHVLRKLGTGFDIRETSMKKIHEWIIGYLDENRLFNQGAAMKSRSATMPDGEIWLLRLLRYLYHSGFMDAPTLRDAISAPHPLYLPGNHKDGVEDLLYTSEYRSCPAPRCVYILNSEFLYPNRGDSCEALWNSEGSRGGWETWLCNVAGVSRHLNLVSPDGTRLDRGLRYVAKYRPNRLLGVLKTSWPPRLPESTIERDELLATFRKLKAPCEGGRLRRLHEAWLPIPELIRQRNVFMGERGFFPFLHLDDNFSDRQKNFEEWEFLCRDLGVSRCGGLSFLLKVLQHIIKADVERSQSASLDKVVELYIAMHEECRGKERYKHQLRSLFAKHKLIFVPAAIPGNPNCWVSSRQWTWELGPKFDPILYHQLRPIYNPVSLNMAEGPIRQQMEKLEMFFCQDLIICQWPQSGLAQDLALSRKAQPTTVCDQLAQRENLLTFGRMGSFTSSVLCSTLSSTPITDLEEPDCVQWLPASGFLWQTRIPRALTHDEPDASLSELVPPGHQPDDPNLDDDDPVIEETSITRNEKTDCGEVAEAENDERYKDLLHNISVAADTTPFPDAGVRTRPARPISTLPLDDHSRNLSSKIGVAGELYVFEMLKKLRKELKILHQWGIDNWTSGKRHYVKPHKGYSGITAYRMSEKGSSDFEYKDANGTFTKFLQSKGYLDQEWTGAKPFYHLEVKSTQNEDRGFIISDSQNDLLQNIISSCTTAMVYVCFHIMRLGSDDMAMEVHVNPSDQILPSSTLVKKSTGQRFSPPRGSAKGSKPRGPQVEKPGGGSPRSLRFSKRYVKR